MKNELRWEGAVERFSGAFELLTLCISLVETGDPLDGREWIRMEQQGSYSMLVELTTPSSPGEKGKVSYWHHLPSHPPITMKLEMINYPSFYCRDRSVRVEPKLLEFLREVMNGGNLGQKVKMAILVVVKRGAVVLPSL